MSKIMSLVKRAPRRFSVILAILAAAIVVPASLWAWGPNRATFTIQNPANYVTFNSITNNPNIGDERNFVGIRESGTNNLWSDNQSVQNGKEYTVRMYVHNNAAANLNLVAENVTAKFNLPTNTAKSIQVNGFLSASNANPGEVYDHATFSSDKNFNVALVPGSIKYENNRGTFNLSESLLTNTGAKLGYGAMDGRIPGCFEFAGYVSFKVKAQVQQTTNFTLDKKVSKKGENKWVENYDAKPGEIVDFVLQYKNTGEVQHDAVTFRDTLPTGLEYVPGSGKWGNARGTYTTENDVNLVNGTGINIGSYLPGAAAWTIFSAKVVANDKLPVCGPNVLRNVGKVNTGGYAVENDATVTVPKTCAPQPKYTCDALSVQRLSRTQFKFSTSYTVENATFKSVTYVVRNAAGAEVSRSTNDTYTQQTAGKYTVEAIVTVTVNGQDKTVTGPNCKKEFEVVPPEVKTIEVCELATKKVITIKETEFDASKHSRNLEDCKEVVKKIEVCELATKTIIRINENEFDASKHSRNLEDCKEVVKKIDVCELASKTIIRINEADFDASKHSKNLEDCKSVPPVTPPTTPSELPMTGAGENILGAISLGALVASITYYAASRRLLGAN